MPWPRRESHDLWLDDDPDCVVPSHSSLPAQRGVFGWTAGHPFDLPRILTGRSFHCCLDLQTLQVPRNRCHSEGAITAHVGNGAVSRIELSVNLDSIPLLRVADVVNGDIV